MMLMPSQRLKASSAIILLTTFSANCCLFIVKSYQPEDKISRPARLQISLIKSFVIPHHTLEQRIGPVAILAVFVLQGFHTLQNSFLANLVCHFNNPLG